MCLCRDSPGSLGSSLSFTKTSMCAWFSHFCDPGCRRTGYRDSEWMAFPSCLLLQVLLYPGALAGSVGQRFEAMVKRGGPLGELVQWADLSTCLTVLGHNLTFSTSQHQLHRLASPPGDPPLLFVCAK